MRLDARDSKYLSDTWIFGVVFCVTLLVDLCIRKIVLPYLLPQLHGGLGFMVGGDSIGYHEKSIGIALLIREHGWSQWQLKPFVTQDSPVGVASALYAVFGPHPTLLLPLNAAVHALGAVLLVRILAPISVRRIDAVFAAMPFVVFPTAAYWHSQLHKDGYYILGMYAWLAGVLVLVRAPKMTVRLWASVVALVGAGSALVWLVRPYILIVLVAILACIALFLIGLGVRSVLRRERSAADLVVRVIFLLATCVALRVFGGAGRTAIPDYALAGYAPRKAASEATAGSSGAASPGSTAGTSSSGDGDGSTERYAEEQLRAWRKACMNWQTTPWLPKRLDDLALSLVVTREGSYSAPYLNARSTIDWQRCIENAGEVVGFVPRAAQVGLTAPFPDQWVGSALHGGRVTRLVAGAEMLFVYIATVAALLGAWRFRREPALWVVLFVALSMLVLYAIATPNIGGLHRMRYGLLMLVVGIGTAEISFRLRGEDAGA